MLFTFCSIRKNANIGQHCLTILIFSQPSLLFDKSIQFIVIFFCHLRKGKVIYFIKRWIGQLTRIDKLNTINSGSIRNQS